jgi:chemotaxis protein MotB
MAAMKVWRLFCVVYIRRRFVNEPFKKNPNKMMRKTSVIALLVIATLSSCVSKKKYTDLEAKYQESESALGNAKMELAACMEEKNQLKDQNAYLKTQSEKLMSSMGEMVLINKKEAENLERSLEAIKEKDLQIKRMSEARTKKDSVTLALVTSLKGALDNMDDEDIQINVDKGVVYVSISDKLLFKSGSYQLSNRAQEVLGKVAKVVNAKPEMDVMVEGHTDNKGVLTTAGFKDNWDLSVMRATAVVRVLQDDLGVDPERLIAAGRSYYMPVADNESAEGRSQNRRTRIIILPKLDEFYGMIEEGMEEAK